MAIAVAMSIGNQNRQENWKKQQWKMCKLMTHITEFEIDIAQNSREAGFVEDPKSLSK